MRGLLVVLALVVLVALVDFWSDGNEDGPAGEAPTARSRVPAAVDEALTALDGAGSDASRTGIAPVAQPTPDGIVLAGRVVDVPLDGSPAQGEPAAGVSVRAHVGFMGGLGEEPPRTTTADDGSFRLQLDDPGRRPLVLVAWADGDARMRTGRCEIRLEPGEHERQGALVPRYPHGSLSGVTLDPAGAGVPDVELTLPATDSAPMRTVMSDAEGHFQMPEVIDVSDIEIKKAGYRVLETRRFRRKETGGWERCEIVLARAGVLRVIAVDLDDDPIAGVRISVDLSSVEKFGRTAFRWSPSQRKPLHAETDEAGAVTFADVWAGQRLRLSIQGSGYTNEALERERDGWAVNEGAATGVPIVVPPGGERTVRVRLHGHVRVGGRVVDESAVPVPQALVELRTLDVPPYGPGYAEARTSTGDDGRFAFSISAARELGRAQLVAADSAPHVGLGNDFDKTPARGARLLDLSGHREDLELVVRPTLAIGGLVQDGEGAPVRAHVRLHPHDAALPFGWSATGARLEAYTVQSGRFRIVGLAAGLYDVEVEPQSDLVTAWVRDVPAGTESLEIVADGARPVKLVVDVRLTEGQPDEIVVLRGRLRPFGDPPPDVPSLPASATYTDPFGWPPSALTLWYGSGGDFDATGRIQFFSGPVAEFPKAYTLEEGLYWIGAKSRDMDGNHSLPIGTGLVRLTAGEYHVRFELTPTVNLEGRVTGALPTEELVIALRHNSGRFVPLNVRGDALQEIIELAANGAFFVEHAPVGDHEVWAGTREELAEGRPRARRAVRLRRGEAATVEMEL